MSNEKLEEAIAKAIYMGIGYLVTEENWAEKGGYRGVKTRARNIAKTVMACPELIAALATPAPHIVDTVEGLEAMPAGSALLDSRGGVILIEDPTVHLSESARAVLRDLAPFTVLHVGGAE